MEAQPRRRPGAVGPAADLHVAVVEQLQLARGVLQARPHHLELVAQVRHRRALGRRLRRQPRLQARRALLARGPQGLELRRVRRQQVRLALLPRACPASALSARARSARAGGGGRRPIWS